MAAVIPAPARPDDNDLVGARELIREAQQRLYEFNYDPGPDDGALNRDTQQAIREFEGKLGERVTGQLTEGLLRRMRTVGGLKPWGAIAFSEATQAWGMSWSHETRVAAVAAARKSCGNAAQCTKVLTFFGTECAAFAHSPSRWSLVARDSTARARLAALEECQKQGARCTSSPRCVPMARTRSCRVRRSRPLTISMLPVRTVGPARAGAVLLMAAAACQDLPSLRINSGSRKPAAPAERSAKRISLFRAGQDRKASPRERGARSAEGQVAPTEASKANGGRSWTGDWRGILEIHLDPVVRRHMACERTDDVQDSGYATTWTCARRQRK